MTETEIRLANSRKSASKAPADTIFLPLCRQSFFSMPTRTRFAFAALSAASVLTGTAAVYNPTPDISITQGNPNGVWTYGYSEDPDLADFGASFATMAHSFDNTFGIGWSAVPGDGPSIAINTSGTIQFDVPPGMLTQHPGPALQAAILRFTAPESAGADIVGEYFAGDDGAILLAILVNGAAIWTATDAGTFDLDATLQAGDTVDFAVYGGYLFGNTPLALTITTAPIPEPARFAGLAGLAALVLATTRRRHRPVCPASSAVE